MVTKENLPEKTEKMSSKIIDILFENKIKKFSFRRKKGVGYTLDVELL